MWVLLMLFTALVIGLATRISEGQARLLTALVAVVGVLVTSVRSNLL